MSFDRSQYREFRHDGWPLCPRCGEDELMSGLAYAVVGCFPPSEDGRKALLHTYLMAGTRCLFCSWESREWQSS